MIIYLCWDESCLQKGPQKSGKLMHPLRRSRQWSHSSNGNCNKNPVVCKELKWYYFFDLTVITIGVLTYTEGRRYSQKTSHRSPLHASYEVSSESIGYKAAALWQGKPRCICSCVRCHACCYRSQDLGNYYSFRLSIRQHDPWMHKYMKYVGCITVSVK